MTKKFSINFDEMIKKIKDQEKGFSKQKDDTYFQPKFKDDGTHVSIIRFLPSPDTDVPFVKKYNHGFQATGGWLIEDCPTSVGQDCPICKANSELWNNGQEELGRERKRRLSYYCNILVVKDPQTPSNEGQVFKWRFGKKIYDKLLEKLSPQDGLSESVNVFDYYEGANFKLAIKQIKAGKKNQPNYDSSVFTESTPVGDDKYVEKINSMLHKLSPIVDPSSFKTYGELQEKLNKVLSGTFQNRPVAQEGVASAPASQSATPANPSAANSPWPEEGDGDSEQESDAGFFAALRSKK